RHTRFSRDWSSDVCSSDLGDPRPVVTETPSYLHGWAANNREVVYVATRPDNPTYDIYRKAIDGKSPEEKLTDTGPGEHVDGCEYSPDGKYIYYNGSESGTMQLWRMRPDGTGKEQLTFDQYNNWFPHISPDNKWRSEEQRLNSSHVKISYAVFCLKKKKLSAHWYSI